MLKWTRAFEANVRMPSIQDMFNFYAENAGCGAGSVKEKIACLRSADISALSHSQDLVMYNL